VTAAPGNWLQYTRQSNDEIRMTTTIRLSTPRRRFLAALLSSGVVGACATQPPRDSAPTVWTLRDVSRVAGLTTEVVGSPEVEGSGARSAVVFDGKGDGVFVPANPLEGWRAFTIEVRFRPDGTGGEEQRFLHIEDGRKQRVLIETRVTPDTQWALDTFLFQDGDHKLTLLDRTRLHPTDRWYWVALVYDGARMSHYIDGVLELEGEVAFAPMTAGRTSIGVRQNLVSWFKGAIAEARFTPAALPASRLRKE
jgi:hypothetical protein